MFIYLCFRWYHLHHKWDGEQRGQVVMGRQQNIVAGLPGLGAFLVPRQEKVPFKGMWWKWIYFDTKIAHNPTLPSTTYSTFPYPLIPIASTISSCLVQLHIV